jgi:hypothetical protein
LLCSSHYLAQTACSKSELKGALIGQNVMTRVVISRKVSGVGAVPVVGVHARFRIASVKLVGDVLQIHLETKFGDAEDLTAHFALPTCDPAAVREQLASVLQFESDASAHLLLHPAWDSSLIAWLNVEWQDAD